MKATLTPARDAGWSTNIAAMPINKLVEVRCPVKSFSPKGTVHVGFRSPAQTDRNGWTDAFIILKGAAEDVGYNRYDLYTAWRPFRGSVTLINDQ